MYAALSRRRDSGVLESDVCLRRLRPWTAVLKPWSEVDADRCLMRGGAQSGTSEDEFGLLPGLEGVRDVVLWRPLPPRWWRWCWCWRWLLSLWGCWCAAAGDDMDPGKGAVGVMALRGVTR